MTFDSNRINLGLIKREKINLGLIAVRVYLGLNSSSRKRENAINLELIGKINLIIKLDFSILFIWAKIIYRIYYLELDFNKELKLDFNSSERINIELIRKRLS